MEASECSKVGGSVMGCIRVGTEAASRRLIRSSREDYLDKWGLSWEGRRGSDGLCEIRDRSSKQEECHMQQLGGLQPNPLQLSSEGVPLWAVIQ